MTEHASLSTWIDGYVRAWNSNSPNDIAALFTEDAEYLTEPYATPRRGRQAIVDHWIENKDEPGDTEFSWSALAETPEGAIVEGRTIYRDPRRTYSNLWVIALDADGRCRRFTEWWMKHPD
ncbi:MAG: nuclear transport factor 2 family protein [Acidimicrobiales bacterium]